LLPEEVKLVALFQYNKKQERSSRKEEIEPLKKIAGKAKENTGYAAATMPWAGLPEWSKGEEVMIFCVKACVGSIPTTSISLASLPCPVNPWSSFSVLGGM